MATTSFSLGPYWDDFIKRQVAEGRYGTGTEVVREALRRMEVETEKRAKLKAHINEGLSDADAGRTVDGPTFMAELARKYEQP
ncbi:MAG: type II toxin-antitoxin system ParD family antitoxin [Pseudomonadota bacterium]